MNIKTTTAAIILFCGIVGINYSTGHSSTIRTTDLQDPVYSRNVRGYGVPLTVKSLSKDYDKENPREKTILDENPDSIIALRDTRLYKMLRNEFIRRNLPARFEETFVGLFPALYKQTNYKTGEGLILINDTLSYNIVNDTIYAYNVCTSTGRIRSVMASSQSVVESEYPHYNKALMTDTFIYTSREELKKPETLAKLSAINTRDGKELNALRAWDRISLRDTLKKIGRGDYDYFTELYKICGGFDRRYYLAMRAIIKNDSIVRIDTLSTYPCSYGKIPKDYILDAKFFADPQK